MRGWKQRESECAGRKQGLDVAARYTPVFASLLCSRRYLLLIEALTRSLPPVISLRDKVHARRKNNI